MPGFTISTKDQLMAWLDERGWLDLSHVYSLSPRPGTPDEYLTQKNDVSFRLGVWVRGGLDAGDAQEFEMYDVKATGVTMWSALDPDSFTDDSYVHDVELDDESKLLKLIFDNDLILECTELHFTEPRTRIRYAVPCLSEREVQIVIADSALPTPADWLAWFSEAGLDVSFRVLGDKACAPQDVPSVCEGYFLQETARIDDTENGLMLKWISRCEEGWSVAFDFWRDLAVPEEHLWPTLAKVLSTRFPDNKITSGNCRLTAIEWLHAIEQGQPYLDSLFLKNEDRV